MLYQRLNNNFLLSKEIQKNLVFNTHPNTVFVYILNLSNYNQDLKLLLACLSSQERIIAKTHCTKALCNRYVISHGILRYILSHYTDTLPQNIEFLYHNNGKPYLSQSIQFNMSHSNDLVVYAISPSYKIGIDVEWRDVTLDIATISDFVFTSYEGMFAAQLKSGEKIRFFYDMWTIKESLVKASGEGLAYPINTIEVAKSTLNKKIHLNNTSGKLTEELFYYNLKIANGYSASMSIEHRINQVVYLEMNNRSNIFEVIRKEYIY